jgi:hypothetical protein
MSGRTYYQARIAGDHVGFPGDDDRDMAPVRLLDSALSGSSVVPLLCRGIRDVCDVRSDVAAAA